MSAKNKKSATLAKELEIARKKLEELNDWQERYKSLVRASPYAVTLTDLEGRIIDFSRKTLTLHGYRRRDELLGKSAFSLTHTKKRPEGRNTLNKKQNPFYFLGYSAIPGLPSMPTNFGVLSLLILTVF